MASRRRAIAATALAVAAPWAAARSDYPSKPIRFVVGYPPGGSVDMAARVLADALGTALHTPVVVDNQGGAAGAIAAQRVVNSAPDGYTLLVGSSNEMAATGLVNRTQKYDPQKDLTPIGLIATGPVLLVAGPKAGVRTLDAFVDAARRHPGKFSYGSSGIGSTLHFAGELVKQRAGIFMTHIPYRGVAPLTSDLAGGNIELAFISPTAALPFIESGRLHPLGVSSARRIALLPDVPALAEHPLLKGCVLTGWFALAGPKNMPPEITQKLATALQAVLQQPEVRRRIEESGSVIATGNEDLGRLIRDDMAQYGKLVDFARIRD